MKKETNALFPQTSKPKFCTKQSYKAPVKDGSSRIIFASVDRERKGASSSYQLNVVYITSESNSHYLRKEK